MKLIAILCALGLVGCTTSYDEETGTKTTRFDAEAFGAATKATGELYDRYRRQQAMQYQQPYYGTPVAYPQYPQYPQQ